MRKMPDGRSGNCPGCDRTHHRDVRSVNGGGLAYHITAQWVRETFPVTVGAVLSSFLAKEPRAAQQVPRCLTPEARDKRQTSRKAGTQSPEATARRKAPGQSSRRTVFCGRSTPMRSKVLRSAVLAATFVAASC